jgi:DNA-binding helix-hairpin-helix protein with protein kinase domain
MLGQGGQGAVYELAMTSRESLALKWYHPRSATRAQRVALEHLIDRGAPSDRFLWPTDFVRTDAETTGFGYAMPMRPPEYVSLVALMREKVHASFRTLATVGLELAHAFLILHSEGLCYRDISFGNVFFDPTSGRVLVCDNDNVAIDGETSSAIKGTAYFMAPEVMRGEALPSRTTDLWSLAVLLFYILLVHHPLEGRRALAHACWDEAAMRDLFGDHPLFIFDPLDNSNEPVPGVHDNALAYWDLYPKFVRDLFTTAFTTGIADAKNGRVAESVWRSAMARLRDAIVYCSSCGRQNIADDPANAPTCWMCGTMIVLPPFLKLGRNLVALDHDTRIFNHHLRRDYDFKNAVAEVTRAPHDPSMWGLRNLGTSTWRATTGEGAEFDVQPGRVVAIVPGSRLAFDQMVGEIVDPTTATAQD